MFKRRNKNQDSQSNVGRKISVGNYEMNQEEVSHSERSSLIDYISFVVLCFLLFVPAYAIAKSAIKRDWIMVAIDALLVPVGFVHGLLMLFGFA